jgi:hypothetical protein
MLILGLSFLVEFESTCYQLSDCGLWAAIVCSSNRVVIGTVTALPKIWHRPPPRNKRARLHLTVMIPSAGLVGVGVAVVAGCLTK